MIRTQLSMVFIELSGNDFNIPSSAEPVKDAIALIKPEFDNNDQHDCHEILGIIMNQLPNHLLKDAFGGELTTITSCVGCDSINTQQEPFCELSLSMLEADNTTPIGSSIEALIDHHLAYHEFECQCNTCDRNTKGKKYFLDKFP